MFAARAEAAEDPEVANGLVRSYQRAARSYRQSLALKHRLRRELKRERREDRTEHARAVSTRKAQVRAAVKALIWTEAEPPEAERLEDDLEEWLADYVVMDDFAATPVEAHVARLRRDLGLAVPPPPGVEGEGQSGGLSVAGADPAQHGGGGFHSDAEAHPPGRLPQSAVAGASPAGGASGPDPQSSA